MSDNNPRHPTASAGPTIDERGLRAPGNPPSTSSLERPEPPVVPWRWQNARAGTAKLPPEGDSRLYVLQLVDGVFVIGQRQTMRAVQRPGGSEFVRASAVPHVAVRETHFTVGGLPVEVRVFALLELPTP